MTAAGIDDLLLAQRHALDTSGWGRGFRFTQPRSVTFWTYVALTAAGAYVYLAEVLIEARVFGPAIGVAAVVFATYGALFWWYTQRIDRYAGQTHKVIVAALAWGAFAAPWALADRANLAGFELWAKAFGQNFALDWSAALTHPVTEELAKAAGLVLLISLAPRLVRTAYDGFILGAFIGLGFQVTEDIALSVDAAQTRFGDDQLSAASGTLLGLLSVGVASHTLYAAVFGAGVVYLAGRPAERQRPLRGLALIATALVLHGLWDARITFIGLLGSTTAVTVLVWGVLLALSLFAVLGTHRLTSPTERAFMVDVLAPEQARGVITSDELAAVSGDHASRNRYVNRGDGLAARRLRGRLLGATTALADTIARSHGLEGADVQYARAAVSRIRYED